MTVGDLITMLRAYPNDDEIEIQVFETNSGVPNSLQRTARFG